MAARDSRRPGETFFDWLDRTTHPDAVMRVVAGGDCHCRPGAPWAHTTHPLGRKEHP